MPNFFQHLFPIQLLLVFEPNVSHLCIFGCIVQVPIAPPLGTKMDPQRKLQSYIGFTLPSIIRYLEPKIGDLFITIFSYYCFYETLFPTLENNTINKPFENISLSEGNFNHLNHCTPQCE